MIDLEAQFERDMISDSQEYTRRTKTSPARYLQMIQSLGGVGTARQLATDTRMHEGFTRAWDAECLNLTAEYLMVFGRDGLYQTLFSAGEIASARKRLKSLGVIAPIII